MNPLNFDPSNNEEANFKTGFFLLLLFKGNICEWKVTWNWFYSPFKTIILFSSRWRESAVNKTWNRTQPRLQDRTYLKQILFNRSCRGAREVTANLILKFMESGPPDRKRDMVDTLTSFLSEVGRSGEASQEFINLYRKVELFLTQIYVQLCCFFCE